MSHIPRKIGYARVSTTQQSIALQVASLRQHGCDAIFTDQGISGATDDRAGLNAAMAQLQQGDVLVVWKLDRLGRSLASLCRLLEELAVRDIGFISLTDGIDTNTSSGRLVFHVMGALAEFERDLIRERTRAGMETARRNGKHLGRPPKLSTTQIHTARQMQQRGTALHSIASHFAVAPITIKRALR